MSYTVIKPIIKYLVAEPVNLAVEEILPSHPDGGKLRSSYTAKQRGMCHKASLLIIPDVVVVLVVVLVVLVVVQRPCAIRLRLPQ